MFITAEKKILCSPKLTVWGKFLFVGLLGHTATLSKKEAKITAQTRNK
jgi:hypothetical protein